MKKILTLVLALLITVLPLTALAEATPVPDAEATAEAAEPTPAPDAEATAEATEAAEAAEPTPAPDPNKVVASVDGDDILYSEVDNYFQIFASQYTAYQIDVTEENIHAYLMDQALNYAIQIKVMQHKAAELGLDKLSDEDLADIEKQAADTYDGYVSTYASYFTQAGASEEDAKKQAEDYLSTMGYPLEKFKEQFTLSTILTRVQESVTDPVTVTDDDVKAAFDAEVAAQKELYDATPAAYCSAKLSGGSVYYTPEGIRTVKHILIAPEKISEINELKEKIAAEDTAEADKADAQTQLDALIAEAQPKVDEVEAKIAAGEDFQSLIDAYGEDPGMQAGTETAETGYYVCEGASYDAAFLAAALALKNVGDVSEPVLGSYGYHIIRYEADVPSGTADFESVKEALTSQALSTAQSEAFSKALDEWTTAATVEKFDM